MRSDVPPEDDDCPPPDAAFDSLERAFDRAETGPEPPARTDRRRDWATAVVFAVAVAVLAAASAYASALFAVDRAAKHTDQRVAVLESDLQQRREAAASQNANRDAQIAELRRLVCTFADHSQPRDESVEDIRRTYQCIPAPTPAPIPSPT